MSEREREGNTSPKAINSIVIELYACVATVVVVTSLPLFLFNCTGIHCVLFVDVSSLCVRVCLLFVEQNNVTAYMIV